MTDANTQPIVVNTPAQVQLAAALRQGVLVLSSVASAMGYSMVAGRLSQLLDIVGPVAAIIVFVWGQAATRSNAKKAAAMASALPDSVAKAK